MYKDMYIEREKKDKPLIIIMDCIVTDNLSRISLSTYACIQGLMEEENNNKLYWSEMLACLYKTY